MSTGIFDLPEETLLRLLQTLDVQSLVAFSLTSRYFRNLCIHHIWPSFAAHAAGVRAVRQNGNVELRTVGDWARLVTSMKMYRASRTLHVAVQLQRTDSVTSLAVKYSVSTQDILRTNALFSESHVATRKVLYIPLVTDPLVTRLTGSPVSLQRPTLMRDCTLADRLFLVVQFQTCEEQTLPPDAAERRENYVRELIVRLVAKGFAVDESEVRFYLEDNEFNISRACKALLRDREWTAND